MSNIDYSLIGKVISFTLIPANIISDDFSNVVLTGIVDWRSAQQFANVAQIHAQILSTLPDPKPIDFKAYPYALVKTSNGSTKPIGLPWISINSVQVISSEVIDVKIRNKGIAFMDNLRQILISNGVTDFDITIID